MRTFGESLIVIAVAIAMICILLGSSIEWDKLPAHVEGYP